MHYCLYKWPLIGIVANCMIRFGVDQSTASERELFWLIDFLFEFTARMLYFMMRFDKLFVWVSIDTTSLQISSILYQLHACKQNAHLLN